MVAEVATLDGLNNGYVPLPQQQAFRCSPAKVRGYGGAMGGGKSRAICEEALDLALEHPGLVTLIARQSHVACVPTTKRTMMNEVLDPALIAGKKESAGEDWQRLFNGSEFHFIGLDDPGRWYSSEIGLLVIDQAEECDEATVVRMITRLRQRGMPNAVILSFNPENPGHWLQRWFILGAQQTDWGFAKRELYATGATHPIGDAEFFFARATDNPHLPDGYVEQTLAGLPEVLRQRYLEGLWLHVSGTCYFNIEALMELQKHVRAPRWTAWTTGEPDAPENPPRFHVKAGGPWSIWAPPVRERWDEETGKTLPAHRYIVSVDTSSGGAQDYSAIHVLDVETNEQVAEWQGKTDPDLLAREAHRAALVYNRATIAPEVTGGWGYSVVLELERRRYGRIYTRRAWDRIEKKWTDRLGWDTNTSTRPLMLDTLERLIREGGIRINGERTLAELLTFVRDDAGRPAAQPGCHDDLVMGLAIAAMIREQMPKQLQRPRPRSDYEPAFEATGY